MWDAGTRTRCLCTGTDSNNDFQGINRLGKGTAKPGTLRPADPNRFKTEDFFSVDAEQDPEYLRRIVEVSLCDLHPPVLHEHSVRHVMLFFSCR